MSATGDGNESEKQADWKDQFFAAVMLVGGVAAVLSRWGSWTAVLPAMIAVAGAARLVTMVKQGRRR